MLLFLFYIFSVLMLVFGLGVIIARNPVTSAMNLVMSFIFLAGLFFTLDAFFLGIIQVLIYAGAVMVLFLFIIMLLNIKKEEQRRFNKAMFAGAIGIAVAFCLLLIRAIYALPKAQVPMPVLGMAKTDDVTSLGRLLFSHYNFPFQMVGVLLLVATIGVVLLSTHGKNKPRIAPKNRMNEEMPSLKKSQFPGSKKERK